MSRPPNRPIRALVVDDSAFARKVVREMLSAHPGIEVAGVARDGEEALEMAEELRPDVITCDLVMPRLDGVGFVRRQMARRPVPILIISSVAEDADKAVEALHAGAVDLIRKPTALANEDLLEIRDRLVEQVLAVAGASTGNLRATSGPKVAVETPVAPAVPTGSACKFDVVVIGISTGGPQALRHFVPQLPANFPVPIAIVLHMPVGYTALFASKLNEISALEVREARDGERLQPGVAFIAQAGRHLTLRRDADGRPVAALTMHPLDKLHRPSADVLLRSAAETFGERVLAVVMTGMGEDGKEGAAWVKTKGGTVLTEAESSCVIYGMPRSVAEAGLSDAAIALSEMAQTLMHRL